MRKTIAGAVLLCACLLTGNAYGATPVTAQGSNTVVLVNGTAQEIYPYNIDGNNYFKLRDMAAILASTSRNFAVEWDEVHSAIHLNTGKGYEIGETDLQFPVGAKTVTAEPSQVLLYCDGEPLAIGAYNIEGNNYFKLRDIGEAVGFAVNWDEDAQLMQIDTDALVETSTVSQGSYMSGNADGSDVELDESFTNPDYWNNLPQLDAEVEPEEGQKEELPETADSSAATGSTTGNGQIQTDVQQLLNGAVLQPKQTQFGILNSLITDFMVENFTGDMDTYTKVKVAYDYFIKNRKRK